jgi:hypothetical protein
VIFKGIFDAMLIVGIFVAPSYLTKNDGFFLMHETGMIANGPSYVFYLQFTVTLAFCSKLRDVNVIQLEREITSIICFLFSLFMMFIDEDLEGIT